MLTTTLAIRTEKPARDLPAAGEDGNVEGGLEDLLRRAQDGDPEAFGDLYDRYLDRIYRYVLFKVNRTEDAEDLTEMVFIKAWEKLHTFSPCGPNGKGFSAWLFRIASNTVIDHYRAVPDEEDLDEHIGQVDQASCIDPELEVLRFSEVEQVRRCLSQLTAQEQQIILLRFVEGLPHAEAAETLGISNVASRVLQHRALAKLRDALAQPEGAAPTAV